MMVCIKMYLRICIIFFLFPYINVITQNRCEHTESQFTGRILSHPDSVTLVS